MSRIWLTTDTHFNHSKLVEIGVRPAGYEAKIAKGLFKIPFEDVLIHLGDICIGDDKRYSKMFMTMPCHTVLVRGNHDRKSSTWYMNHGWDFACESFTLEAFGKTILFSHKPQRDTGSFDINVHGHFHTTDHRRYDPEFNDILNEKHKLLAIENTDYQPILLNKFLKEK